MVPTIAQQLQGVAAAINQGAEEEFDHHRQVKQAGAAGIELAQS